MNILKYIGKTKVEVFVTKNRKFRASIKEPSKPRYEVTIGGKSWESEKGKKHAERIYGKILELVDSISGEATRLVPTGFIINRRK